MNVLYRTLITNLSLCVCVCSARDGNLWDWVMERNQPLEVTEKDDCWSLGGPSYSPVGVSWPVSHLGSSEEACEAQAAGNVFSWIQNRSLDQHEPAQSSGEAMMGLSCP